MEMLLRIASGANRHKWIGEDLGAGTAAGTGTGTAGTGTAGLGPGHRDSGLPLHAGRLQLDYVTLTRWCERQGRPAPVFEKPDGNCGF